MTTPIDAASIIEHATREVNELAFILGYTDADVDAIKAAIDEQAGSSESMGVTDFVDMCTALARVRCLQ